jgi:multimeric flavodoxin WrbA
MKVVAIGGSPRLNGNTNYLIDEVLNELAKKGIETEKIVLNQYRVNPCQAHSNCRQSPKCLQEDDAPWILEKFSQADGVIIASPVYFGSISAQTKTFLDRTFFLYTHNIPKQAKCFGLIAIAGRAGFDQAIQELRKFVGLRDASQAKVFTSKAAVGGPDQHARDNPQMVEEAREMGRQMARVLLGMDEQPQETSQQ